MGTFCPQCGHDVDVDEDGCCVFCGATATGDAVDAANEEIARLRAELAEKDRRIAELAAKLAKARELTRDLLAAWRESARREALEDHTLALEDHTGGGVMRPHWSEDHRHWVDLDSPVSDDPDDGHQGISDLDVEMEITLLRAELAGKDRHIADLEAHSAGARENAEHFHRQWLDAEDELEARRHRITKLEARAEYAEEQEQAAVEARQLLACDLHREKVKVADLEAQLAAMTSRYTRAATEIAHLEAQLAEAREIIQHALAWEKACTFNVRNSVVNDLNLLSACRRYRAALDAAREE